jgi:hypothetical protein
MLLFYPIFGNLSQFEPFFPGIFHMFQVKPSPKFENLANLFVKIHLIRYLFLFIDNLPLDAISF